MAFCGRLDVPLLQKSDRSAGTQYNLHVGTTGVGSTNIATSGSLTSLTYTVNGIPTTGGTLNVPLYSLINGAWQYTDYTYTEATEAPAVMTSPAPGSTLSGPTVPSPEPRERVCPNTCCTSAPPAQDPTTSRTRALSTPPPPPSPASRRQVRPLMCVYIR